jgi:hypothetical protein
MLLLLLVTHAHVVVVALRLNAIVISHVEWVLATETAWLLLLHGAILAIVLLGCWLLLIATSVAHLAWHLRMELLTIRLLLIVVVLLLLVRLHVAHEHGVRLELWLFLRFLLLLCTSRVLLLLHGICKRWRRERIRATRSNLGIGSRLLVLLRSVETKVKSSVSSSSSCRLGLGLRLCIHVRKEVVLVIILGSCLRLRR